MFSTWYSSPANSRPAWANNLLQSESSDVSTKGVKDFSFQLHGHEHAFETSTEAERDGWVVAIKKAVEEAKALRDDIINKESYKEEVSKLGESPFATASK